MYEELIKDLRNCFGTDSMFCDCDSCHYEGLVDDHDYSKCVETLGVEAADAIERLQKPQWIPVTERLPEENGFYLCLYEAKRPGGIAMDEGLSILQYLDNKWHLNEIYTVTHWMPLPEPPKGDNP